MRYRPMGPGGAIVSAVSLSLTADPARPRASDWVTFLYAALESGINAFEVNGADAALTDGLAQALSAVDRRLVCVAWRLARRGSGRGRADEVSPEGLIGEVAEALERTGLGRLDAVLLDEPAVNEPPAESLAALAEMRDSGLVGFIGLAGDADCVDDHVAGGAFDVLGTTFNLTSGWRERNRLRAAGGCETAVIGLNPYPADFITAALAAARKAPRTGAWRSPLSGRGTYEFLETTRGWSAEEICLAYALTEPALASVQVAPSSVELLERLAAVTERELPPGLAAQIEMARFSPTLDAETRRSA